MTGGELNLAWARAILATLAEYGLEEIEIAPGSRSAPLVLASRSLPGLNTRVHLDERSAGFFAVGYGRSHLGPAAVITTSGTAVANLLPAVVEADMSDVPLLLITADRPPGMRGADANQTIMQPGIFGDRVRFAADLPEPTRAGLKGTGANSLVALVRKAASHAAGPPGGPVHLNVPFDLPLQPESPDELDLKGPGEEKRLDLPSLEVAVEDGELVPRGPWRRRTEARRRGRDQEAMVAHQLALARRPLLVAGPATDPGLDGPAAARFAHHRNVPVLADPLSGARFTASVREGSIPSPILGAYDHFLRVPEVVSRFVPDLIIRVGRSPTSPAAASALARWKRSRQIVVDDGAHRKDHQGLAHHYLHASAGAVLERLASGDDDDEGSFSSQYEPWTRGWAELEEVAWAAVEEGPAHPGNEGDYAAALVRSLPPGSTLFVSSSMPVRDVDAYGRPGALDLEVLGNRGASGIDGVVSTALGCAAGGAGPVAVLIGDIAFYHDMNGLLATRDQGLQVVFVVVDNDGGGIFHMLPIRDFEPAFTPYFATPHGLDFEHAARLYGLPFTDAATPAELEITVRAAVASRGSGVIRVRTDREVNRRRHEQIRARVARRIREHLNRETT
ncbi:MAG: 2-succinyl-5-enolpyruvyl-6-hydroxy-3-cyclohexene-1-carboxylic-acid synthase [Gemmatimonadetes bacterium]|nr:2-succinyl-5-enolpyruvyl-6-hydroxy-3-cyclohexene-1-carboxylic-acid synthase [Gemmatimonadota bacterium]